MILAISDLQITPILPTKFQVKSPFGLGEEAKNRFSRWPRPSWILDREDLAIFDLQVTLMLPIKFKVNKAFGSKEAKYRLSRWPPWQPSWISDLNYFSYF